MKSFIRFISEGVVGRPKMNPVVFSFGRMNPPTSGHEALVNKVMEEADRRKAHHEIVLSGSQDPDKNPLSSQQKVKHARRAFPGANITAATPDQPTLIHHLTRLHQAGHNHLVFVAGSDRLPEYQKLISRYNGQADKSGNIPFNFKKIEYVSSGDRDPDSEGVGGMSASKMREHVRNNDYYGFRQGVPSTMSDSHAREMYNDVATGMTPKPKKSKT